jgi:hypothetical protein
MNNQSNLNNRSIIEVVVLIVDDRDKAVGCLLLVAGSITDTDRAFYRDNEGSETMREDVLQTTYRRRQAKNT